ncbi:uncharacterized protein PHACADRAFT_107069, partial [Phanerochaete carnosa HHB-10118-sp]
STKQIKGSMQTQMPLWGGVWIHHGGDIIRCASAVRRRQHPDERNASYVRYEVAIGNENRRAVYYGRLEKILKCNLPQGSRFWRDLQGCRLLLAVITPCVTTNRDATQVVTSYCAEQQSQVVVDLRTVQSVVGRIFTREKWGIIDRSSNTARTVFVEDED